MTKFIKSTMWESKIEKGAVDGSTGYYVEVKNVVLEMIKSGRVNNGGGGIIGKMEVGKNGEVGKEDEVNLSTTNDNSGGKDGVLSKGSAGPDILSTTTTTVTETTVMRSTGEWFTVGSVIQKTVRLVSSGFNFIPFSPLSLFRASPSPLPESKSKTKSRKSRSSRSSKSNRETDTQKPKIKSKSLLLLLLTIVSLVNLIQVVSLLEKLTILVSFSSSSTMDENGLEFGAGSLIPNVGQRNSNGGAYMQKDIEIPSGTEHKGGVLDNISNKLSRRNSKINLLWRRLKILKKEMDEIWEVVSTVEGGNIGRGDGTEVENHVKV
ncbi:hypothetical protein BKA69DRAFT_493577 [Paraphysoderma sedebokerense]|nr:hypothetical protein BKA69DRAFT_493577 [Paraphysoderma sedebokerense]